jgi:cell division protein FtsN
METGVRIFTGPEGKKMEQKRTIWIVLAAGIFLMVVLGAAMILYAPETKKNTTALYQRDSGSVWMSPEAAESRRNDPYLAEEKFPPKKEESIIPKDDVSSVTANIAHPAEGTTSLVDNVTVVSTGSTNIYNVGETTIDLNSLKNSSKEVAAVTPQNKAAENAIRETNEVYRNVEKNEPLVEKQYASQVAESAERKNYVAEKIEPVRPESAPKKNSVQPKISSAPKNSSAANSAKTSAANSSAQKKSSANSVASNSAKSVQQVSAPKKSVDRFWVQAGSYTTTKNADEARGVLESNKIPCEVFTSDVKGTMHYRVRVGPYTTRSEAEYWKNRIDAIPLFASNKSFVTSTSSAK